jgi:hypothetical protein
MTLVRAVLLAVVVAAAVVGAAVFGMNVPWHWALLMALPAAVLTLVAGLLSDTYDADWTAEPDPPAASVTLHATFLTERLERSAIDQYRFVSRVQPRLRRVAQSLLGLDLNTREARERLGADLHRLLTSPDAQLPSSKKFAALMRRLEEL